MCTKFGYPEHSRCCRVESHSFVHYTVKGQGHQTGLLTAAFTHRQLQRSAWERIEHGKLLLRCRLQARLHAA